MSQNPRIPCALCDSRANEFEQQEEWPAEKWQTWRDWWIRGYQSIGIDELFPPRTVHQSRPAQNIHKVLRIIEAVQQQSESEASNG